MNTIGTRETLDRKIQGHLDDILLLGSRVEQAIINAVKALKEQDKESAQRIYDEDKIINQKRFEIEHQALTTVATQQPMVRDLRLLASIIDISGELERIGDYAKGIAQITLRIGNEPFLKPLIDIPRMADLASSMLHRALDAFVRVDAETARSIPECDDEIDNLYNQVYRELLVFMFKDPSAIDQATFLIWVAHNLERAADRVTNICERTVFIATGKLQEISASDDEIQIEE